MCEGHIVYSSDTGLMVVHTNAVMLVQWFTKMLTAPCKSVSSQVANECLDI